MTRTEFEDLCRAVCPHCAADQCRTQPSLRQRIDTGEFVHDSVVQRPGISHTLCFANYLRNSERAKNLAE